jgi:hypothetical protein
MYDFPYEKTSRYEKPWTEEEVTARLTDGSLAFPPAALTAPEQRRTRSGAQQYDGILEARWNGELARYVFEYKSSSTPKILEVATLQARTASAETGLLALVILPYLGENALLDLEQKGISGMDLCGNGVLISPRFRIWRSGSLNRFKENRSIQKPYRGDSSIFARCLLLRREFASLRDLQAFAREKTLGRESKDGTDLSLSTASKVVAALEQEMVVSKQANSIRLTDARRLMDLLRMGADDRIRVRLSGTTTLDTASQWSQLAMAKERCGLRYAATGIASAARYAVLSGITNLTLYVDDLEIACQALKLSPGRAFANIELIDDRKNEVYFDTRKDDLATWSSPIQTWLELSRAGPREQDAAMELQRRILDGGADLIQ